jgi:hypothetical protein
MALPDGTMPQRQQGCLSHPLPALPVSKTVPSSPESQQKPTQAHRDWNATRRSEYFTVLLDRSCPWFVTRRMSFLNRGDCLMNNWRSEYRRCEVCKKEYRPERKVQSYCKPECRWEAAYKRKRLLDGNPRSIVKRRLASPYTEKRGKRLFLFKQINRLQTTPNP